MTTHWYRSTNYGGTWQPTAVQPRSPLAAMAATGQLDAGQIHDDGKGNLARHEDHGSANSYGT